MVDSHCHIAGPEFVDDLDEVIARAAAAGVTHALVILAADDQPEIDQAHAAVKRLMEDDGAWAEASRRVLEHFRERHSVPAVVAKYEAEIERLAARKAA